MAQIRAASHGTCRACRTSYAQGERVMSVAGGYIHASCAWFAMKKTPAPQSGSRRPRGASV